VACTRTIVNGALLGVLQGKDCPTTIPSRLDSAHLSATCANRMPDEDARRPISHMANEHQGATGFSVPGD